MTNDKLVQSLKKVNLVNSSNQINEHLTRAERENYSYRQFLQGILDEEIEYRRQKRINERLRQSKLRVIKTIDTYNFSFPDKINGKLIKSLFDLNFLPLTLLPSSPKRTGGI